jgi:hypothetical protein
MKTRKFLILRTIGGQRGEISPVHTMKAYKWSKGVTSPILNLCARWRQMVPSTPWLFHAREGTLVFNDWQVGWPQHWSGHFVEGKKSLALLEFQHQIVHSVVLLEINSFLNTAQS